MSGPAVRAVFFAAAAAVVSFLVCWTVLFVVDVRQSTNVVAANGLHIDYMLSPQDAGSARALGNELDVTPAGVAIVRVNGHLAKIGPNQSLDDLGLDHADIASYAVDDSDTMLTVSRGYLGTLDRDGKPLHAVPLPYDNAKLAHSQRPGVVYLFSGDGSDYRLYGFQEDGLFEILLRADEPIVAATDTADDIFAATADRVVRITPQGARQVFALPVGSDLGPIVSIAAARGGPLFVSTNSAVFAVSGLVAISIINNSGGTLQLRGNRLYVLDVRRQMLYVAFPASEALFHGQGG